MTENEYLSSILKIKKRILLLKKEVKKTKILLYEETLMENWELLDKLITYRKKTMGPKDFENKYLLSTNCFKEYNDEDRIIISKIIFDIEGHGKSEKRTKEYKKLFDSNYLENILFKEYKQIGTYVRDNDKEGLINFEKIEKEYISGNHFKHKQFFYKSAIPDKVLEQLLKSDAFDAKSYPFFIKMDGTYFSKERDTFPILTEATINPSNPKWTKTFNIHNNLFEGSAYELLEDNIDEPSVENRAFKNKDFGDGVRRIESIAKRENNGRFSMMIEELSIEDDIIVGRCIHLDSQEPTGTNFLKVTLKHIDYSINVYGKSHERLSHRIDKKEKFDAILRGHLFRLENYPFRKLPDLAYLLFKSKPLTEEWAKETFKKVN